MKTKIGNSIISMKQVTITSILLEFHQKINFFEECSWFKFHNLGLTLGMNSIFYTSIAKGLKLKVRKFWEIILRFVEVTGENGSPCLLSSSLDFLIPSSDFDFCLK